MLEPASKTIFICDEMKVNVARIIADLQRQGYIVEYYPNASDGYAYLKKALSTAAVPRLMIVDMALLAGDNELDFPDDAIDEGQITGIVLIEKLFSYVHSAGGISVDEIARRLLLYTRVNEESYVLKARQFASERKICFSKKRIEDDGEFLGLLQKLLTQ